MASLLFSSNVSLARRLEHAEAANAFALARSAKVVAESICGGCAIYGGAGSPFTHLLGGGMEGPVSAAEFDRLEEFYRKLGSPCLIDACPLADISFLDHIFRRGYKVIELNNLLARTISPCERFPSPPQGVEVKLVHGEDVKTWSRVVAQGFANEENPPSEMLNVMSSMTDASQNYLVTVDGTPAGGGAMGMQSGVGMFYGDATRTIERGRGVQTAVINARLQAAQQAGCDLAMVTVVPGTASHRNYERAGFELVYMRVNVIRELN